MAKTAKKVQSQSLESIMWNCRNALRGTVGGNEKNRDAVMGLVFLKFAGDKFEKRRSEIKAEHGDIPEFVYEDDSFYLSENVYYINETARWSYIVTNASKNDIAVILDKAMADIEDKNPPLKGALPQNFYATLGTRKEQIKGLIDEINKIDESHFKDKDLINWQTGKGYKNIPELCKSATLDEIKKQGYSLAPSKYIEFIDHDLEIDYKKEMKRIQTEMKLLLDEEKKSQKMLEKAFEGIGYGVKK
jgi:type I restriction-modification system DNA methylase subunit